MTHEGVGDSVVTHKGAGGSVTHKGAGGSVTHKGVGDSVTHEGGGAVVRKMPLNNTDCCFLFIFYVMI